MPHGVCRSLLLPFAFVSGGVFGKAGAVSRARGFRAAKRTLDTAPAFPTIAVESEGKRTPCCRCVVRSKFMRAPGRSPPASGSPGSGAAAPGCTTEALNTHKIGKRLLLYSWHPLYGRELTVRGENNRRGTIMYICSTGEDQTSATLEIPAWMFDGAICCRFASGGPPHVDVCSLKSLRVLLGAARARTPDMVKAQHQSNVSGGSDAQARKENDGSVFPIPRTRAKPAIAKRSQPETSSACGQAAGKVRRSKSNQTSCSGGKS
jgi:hypothetical protein